MAQVWKQVGPGARILIRVGGIDVEEAAAVGAELLDRNLTGDRALRQGLLGAFERGGIDIGAEVLRHAERDQHQREHDGEREQHVKRRARQVDPEIADGGSLAAREGPCDGDSDGKAGGSGDEVLHRQSGHLAEIGERAFAAVALPVGVGDERGRRVEGQVRAHGVEPLRVQRQDMLEAQDRVEQDEAGGVENQQGHGVGEPILLAFGIDAGERVEASLDRTQDGIEQRWASFEYRRHVDAERPRRGNHQREHQRDLEPAVEGHRWLSSHGCARCKSAADARKQSELLGMEQRVRQVCGKAHRNDGAEHEVQHGNPHVLDAQPA